MQSRLHSRSNRCYRCDEVTTYHGQPPRMLVCSHVLCATCFDSMTVGPTTLCPCGTTSRRDADRKHQETAHLGGALRSTTPSMLKSKDLPKGILPCDNSLNWSIAHVLGGMSDNNFSGFGTMFPSAAGTDAPPQRPKPAQPNVTLAKDSRTPWDWNNAIGRDRPIRSETAGKMHASNTAQPNVTLTKDSRTPWTPWSPWTPWDWNNAIGCDRPIRSETAGKMHASNTNEGGHLTNRANKLIITPGTSAPPERPNIAQPNVTLAKHSWTPGDGNKAVSSDRPIRSETAGKRHASNTNEGGHLTNRPNKLIITPGTSAPPERPNINEMHPVDFNSGLGTMFSIGYYDEADAPSDRPNTNEMPPVDFSGFGTMFSIGCFDEADAPSDRPNTNEGHLSDGYSKLNHTLELCAPPERPVIFNDLYNEFKDAKEEFLMIKHYYEREGRQELLRFFHKIAATVQQYCISLSTFSTTDNIESMSLKTQAPATVASSCYTFFREYTEIRTSVTAWLNNISNREERLIKLFALALFLINKDVFEATQWSTIDQRALSEAILNGIFDNDTSIKVDDLANKDGADKSQPSTSKDLESLSLDLETNAPRGWRCQFPDVFFLDFSIADVEVGRVLIQTNPDLAPVMSANFAVLCSRTRNLSYVGCNVFQCWKRESIISGDTEHNNGTGGKAILNNEFILPDETNLPSFCGAVGMRRLKHRFSKHGEVSSQFRIMLKEIKGITGIFGRVVRGIDVVERIADLGDDKGNPTMAIKIVDCGKLSTIYN